MIWTTEAESRLRQMVSWGWPDNRIGSELGCTTRAVKSKREKLRLLRHTGFRLGPSHEAVRFARAAQAGQDIAALARAAVTAGWPVTRCPTAAAEATTGSGTDPQALRQHHDQVARIEATAAQRTNCRLFQAR